MSPVLRMYLGLGHAGVSVQLTVISVGLAVTATHPVLSHITLLQSKRQHKLVRNSLHEQISVSPAGPRGRSSTLLVVSMCRFRKQIKALSSFTCKQRQTGSPRSVDTHSRPAPQKVLAHTDWSWDKDREYVTFPWCLCIWNGKYGIRSVCELVCASAPDGDLWPPTGEVLNDNGTLPLSLRQTHTHRSRWGVVKLCEHLKVF